MHRCRVPLTVRAYLLPRGTVPLLPRYQGDLVSTLRPRLCRIDRLEGPVQYEISASLPTARIWMGSFTARDRHHQTMPTASHFPNDHYTRNDLPNPRPSCPAPLTSGLLPLGSIEPLLTTTVTTDMAKISYHQVCTICCHKRSCEDFPRAPKKTKTVYICRCLLSDGRSRTDLRRRKTR